MTAITLNIQLAEPILLELAVADGIQINTVKAGPPGANGLSVELQATVDYLQWRYVGQTEWTNLIAVADLIGPSGEDGREVELQVTSTHVQWRYTGDVAWTNLVALSVITGPPGIPGEDAVNIELQKSATHIQWRYIGDVTWNDLVALSEITGDDGTPGAPGAPGTPVELQLGATHIQWRYIGDALWTDIIAIADLTGNDGAPGIPAVNIELQTSATHIQWRYVGEVTWTDLVALADITGNDGAPGIPGAPGAPVELQLGATHIQWRYVGDLIWTNLIAIADLMADVQAHELAFDHTQLHAPGSDNQDLSGYETLSNKVTDFQVTPDDTHYPSEKLVKDSLDQKVSEIIATQDPEYPISYLSYRRNGVQIDITEIPKADGMIKGCMVSYISGLRFGVSAGAYYMTGTLNRVDSDTKTLADAHPTLPRIDLIAVDNTPAIIVIQGTPAANPQKPSIDPETQIERTNILVPAGATEPGNIITDKIIYDEGDTGEFILSAAGVTVDGAYAPDKFHGTYSINVGALSTADTITLTSDTVLDRTDFENFVLYLKLKASMSNKQWLYVGFLNGGVLVTNEIRVPLTKNNTTSWQVVIMALTGLTWSQAEFDAVRIRWSGASHAGMLLDYIKLETGVIQVEYNDSVTLTGDVQGTGVTGSPILTTMAGQYERLTGAKESVSDEGIAGQESWDDDYLYKCVVSGAAGFAIWKKIPMLKTREPR